GFYLYIFPLAIVTKKDTVDLPTDSIYLLTLFREIPNYSISVPSFVARNRILFGYYGEGKDIQIEPLSTIPDTISTKILKDPEKDTLNFWFTPYEMDSLVFTVTNEKLKLIDTFTVKSRKVGTDSLKLAPNQTGSLSFNDPFYIGANTPLEAIDTLQMSMMKTDSSAVSFSTTLDSTKNRVHVDFEVEPNESYALSLLPGAITDFFGQTNDTVNFRLATKSLADYGNLRLNIATDSLSYPLLIQLTDAKGATQHEIYAEKPQVFEFNALDPATYLLRVIFDSNGNQKWDTGNYLKRIQPEKVSYYPNEIELRANWELEQTFIISD
ncbi:MAG: hypothetical protein AAFX53_08690, partial [Bacteroidota bacterium]